MAIVFNQAKGRGIELHDRVNNSDPANAVLVLMLLQETTSADAVLRDYDTFAAILAVETECTATGYARIVLDDTDIGPSTVNDTTDVRSADITDPVWASIGGAVNNNLDKIVIGYDPDSTGGTDSDIIPITADDFVQATNGGDITGTVAAGGYLSAA